MPSEMGRGSLDQPESQRNSFRAKLLSLGDSFQGAELNKQYVSLLTKASVSLSSEEMINLMPTIFSTVPDLVFYQVAHLLAGAILSGPQEDYYKWAASLDSGKFNRALLSSAVATLVSTDRVDNAEHMIKDLKGETKKESALSFARAIANRDGDRAVNFLFDNQFLEKYNNNELKELVFLLDKDTSFQKVLEFGGDFPAAKKENWEYSVFRKWAFHDPVGAWDGLRAIEGPSRLVTQKAVIESWYSSNFNSLAVEINAMKEGSLKDNASAEFARHAFDRDPETAREWVDSIDNSDLREKIAAELFK